VLTWGPRCVVPGALVTQATPPMACSVLRASALSPHLLFPLPAQGTAPSVPEQPQQQSAPPAPAPGAWQTLHTPEGRAYYFNPSTNTTQWEPPSGY
jgi:hypothetical protein